MCGRSLRWAVTHAAKQLKPHTILYTNTIDLRRLKVTLMDETLTTSSLAHGLCTGRLAERNIRGQNCDACLGFAVIRRLR